MPEMVPGSRAGSAAGPRGGPGCASSARCTAAVQGAVRGFRRHGSRSIAAVRGRWASRNSATSVGAVEVQPPRPGDATSSGGVGCQREYHRVVGPALGRLAVRRTVHFDLGIRLAREALGQDQVDPPRIEQGQQVAEGRLGADLVHLAHEYPAVPRGDQHLRRAGFPGAEAVLAGPIHVEAMLGVLHHGHTQSRRRREAGAPRLISVVLPLPLAPTKPITGSGSGAGVRGNSRANGPPSDGHRCVSTPTCCGPGRYRPGLWAPSLSI